MEAVNRRQHHESGTTFPILSFFSPHVQPFNHAIKQILHQLKQYKYIPEQLKTIQASWRTLERTPISRRPFVNSINKFLIKCINLLQPESDKLLNTDAETITNNARNSAAKKILKWCEHAIYLAKHIKNSPILPCFKQLTYVHGLVCLYIIFNTKTPTTQHKMWQTRLSNISIHPSNYTWWRFIHKHVVYLKIDINSKHAYVGMTSNDIENRELSRKRKQKQVDKDLFVQCEPAIRFWKKTKTSHKFPPIIIHTTTSTTLALATESFLVSKWQPSLNMPFITQHTERALSYRMRKKPAFPIPNAKYKTPQRRFWKKVRRRAQTVNAGYCNSKTLVLSPPTEAQHMMLVTIFRLADQGIDSWFAQRALLSPNVKSIMLHALAKQTRHIEEPHRNRARAKLKVVFRKRSIKFPPEHKSIIIPTLAHETFSKNVRRFISDIIQENKETLPLFHLPSQNALFSKNSTLASYLHNWNQLENKHTNIRNSPTCPCLQLLKKHPQHRNEQRTRTRQHRKLSLAEQKTNRHDGSFSKRYTILQHETVY